MAKDVINVDGEDRVVREDTAKSYRGTIWALGSLIIVLGIAALIFFVFFVKTATDGSNSTSPANLEQQRR